MNPKLVKLYALVCLLTLSMPCCAQSQTGKAIVVQSYAEANSPDFIHQKAFIGKVNKAFAKEWVIDVLADEELVSASETLEAVNLHVIDGMFSRVADLGTMAFTEGLAEKYEDWRSDEEFLDVMASEQVKVVVDNALKSKKLIPLGVYLCEQYVMLAKTAITNITDIRGKSVFTTSAMVEKAFLAHSAEKVTLVSAMVAEELLSKRRVDQDILAIELGQALEYEAYQRHSYLLPRTIAPQSVCVFGLSEKSWGQLSLAQQQTLLEEFQAFKRIYQAKRQVYNDNNWRALLLKNDVKKIIWSDAARNAFIAASQGSETGAGMSGVPAMLKAYKKEFFLLGEVP